MIKRKKHNYTSEIELKSLLIRIKNNKCERGELRLNERINKYIKLHKIVNENTDKDSAKRARLKRDLKERIIKYSEQTTIDDESFERFGVIILLMIKKYLTKPNFSSYTYTDDFFSDAVYKILKYVHNYDHTKISEITNQPVNAFSYITQIIHNSVLFILNTKKKENTQSKKQVEMENLNHSLQLKIIEIMQLPEFKMATEENIKNVYLCDVLYLKYELMKLKNDIEKFDRVNVFYPKDYILEYDEMIELSPMLQSKVSIIRRTNKNE